MKGIKSMTFLSDVLFSIKDVEDSALVLTVLVFLVELGARLANLFRSPRNK